MTNLLVHLTITLPARSITDLELFLQDLAENGVEYSATMDSHPSPELLAQLPDRLRAALQSG